MIGEVTGICIHEKACYADLMDMLLLYKLLKKERNNFNHMSNDDIRASFGQIQAAIRLFIKKVRKVYKDIE